MGRKSKRGAIEEVIRVQEKIPTAAYVRLSVEKDGNESIQNQITLLHRYIEDSNELELTETYIDNGYTGTEFERPEFLRMMEDVYCGKIRCILVKDLSRFGRNYLDAGNYIENIFPKLNVRLIAVTDNFDSSRIEDRNSISLPIKNMINEMYARDFSKKSTTYFEQHSRIGDYKIQRAPYGYNVDRQRNVMIPDPVAAPVVQMIFRWFLLGVPMNEIADRINDRNLPCPYGYKMRTEGYVPLDSLKVHIDKWGHSPIYQIIRCEAYKGDRVLGKRRKVLYRDIPLHKASPDEWIVHHNTHEALVPASDFDKISLQLQERKAEHEKWVENLKPNENGDLFKEKVYCMECQRKLKFNKHNRRNETKKTGHYRCYDNLRAGATDGRRVVGKRYTGSTNLDGSRRDCGKLIHHDFIKIVALDAIRNLMKNFLDRKQVVKHLKNSKNGGRYKVISREISIAEETVRKVQNRLENLYSDFVAEFFSQEEYLELKEHYIDEEQTAKNKLSALNQELRRMEETIDRFLEWCDLFSENDMDNSECEKAMIEALIERIEIGDHYEVAIRFTCSDIFEEINRIMEEK